jgi:hypothetical protein
MTKLDQLFDKTVLDMKKSVLYDFLDWVKDDITMTKDDNKNFVSPKIFEGIIESIQQQIEVYIDLEEDEMKEKYE